LNKIERCFEWKDKEYNNIQDALDLQEKHTSDEFRDRTNKAIVEFAEQGLNSALYWENDDPKKVISLIPTSAHTGEGIPDLIGMITKMTQEMISGKIEEKEDFECTVLEVKKIDGLGTTIDVILVNGTLRVDDTIVLSGFNGPIATNIRAILTPHPLKEMRVKGDYIHHKTLKGAMGIKISAPNLEDAIAGSSLMVAKTKEQIEECKVRK
jgi:translation initiation factor 5B